MLMNDMWYSSSASSFYVSTAARELSEAKVYKMKYFSKSRLLREVAWAIASFILLNVPFYKSVHLNWTLCLTIRCKGLTIWEKSGTNLHTKLIVPIKFCIPFLLWDKGVCAIYLILSRSMEIPLLEIMWPNNFPSNMAKTHFFEFKEMPYFWQRSKICFRWKICSSLLLNKVYHHPNKLLWPIKQCKVISIALWKIAPVLIIPKGIIVYAKVPHLVLKVVFSLSCSATNNWL